MRDPKYLKWIRSKGCVICARKAVAHHEQISHRGVGLKCSDHETIPLCNVCHRRRHERGKLCFWKEDFFSLPSCYIGEESVDFMLAKMIIGFLSEYIRGENG